MESVGEESGIRRLMMANNTMNDENKKKALDAAIAKLEKDFGKGAVMKLGDPAAQVHVETVPTGSLSLDLALGVGGVPKGRIIEIYGPESSGKTTVALHMIAEVQKRGGIAGFIDAEHALDPAYAKNIGVDIDNIGVEEIEFALPLPYDGLRNDLTVIVDESGIFRDEYFFVARSNIGVQYPTGGIHSVATFGCFGVVIHVVAVIELGNIENLFARDGIDAVDAFDSPRFVFGRVAPGNGFGPVEMWGNRVSHTVLFDFESFVSAVSRVGQSFTDNRVAYPVNELFVFRIGDFGIVHPESIERDAFRFRIDPPQGILICGSHLE